MNKEEEEEEEEKSWRLKTRHDILLIDNSFLFSDR